MDFLQTAAAVPLVAAVTIRTGALRYLFHLIYELQGFILNLPAYWVQNPNIFFVLLLTLRYYRLVGHILGNYLWYRPDEPPENPTVTNEHVHVILPTIDPGNTAFKACIQSILAHSPRWLTIVCGGEVHVPLTEQVVESLGQQAFTTINIIYTTRPGKRQQMFKGLKRIARDKLAIDETIVVFVDDHAWWEGRDYLAFLLAPFENPNVGLVGTRKRVQRDEGLTFIDNMINMIGCYYLERHNFEITGQNSIDGGAFVISARTCAVRAQIVLQDHFQRNFTREMCTLPIVGTFGPLAADDDNFITRFVKREGWHVKFQSDDSDENIMYTTLGINGWKKVHGQLLRWAQSQWRSNYTSLRYDSWYLMRYWLWTLHVGYLWSFFNVAIFWDTAIFYMWSRTSLPILWWQLAVLILGSKCVKISSHLWRNPRDILFLPVQILFAYFHGYFKIRSFFSANDISWGGRNITVNTGADSDDDNNRDDNLRGTPPKRHAEEAASFNLLPPSVTSSMRTERISPTPTLQNTKQPALLSTGSPSRGISKAMPANVRSKYRAPYVTEGSQVSEYEDSFASTNFRPESNINTGNSAGSSPVFETGSSHSTQESSPTNNNPSGGKYGNPLQFAALWTWSTPWGRSNTRKPHATPANMRESQYNDEGYDPQLSLLQSIEEDSSPRILQNGFLSDYEQIPHIQEFAPASTSRITPETVTHRSLRSRSPLLSSTTTISDKQSPDFKPIPLGTDFPRRGSRDPRTPPYQRFPMDLRRDSIPRCFDTMIPPPAPKKTWVAPKINFAAPMPPVPNFNQVPIIFKHTNASPIDLASSPIAAKFAYNRDFVRGGDCDRIHGEGRFLTEPRTSLGGRQRCRSPQRFDRYGEEVVPRRPRW